jgi:hypothetical protein
MAPLPIESDPSRSPLGLETRSSSQGFPQRSSNLSPIEAGSYLATRNAAPPTSNTPPGSGSFDPHNVNNRGILALFGLIGVGMVLASIWFFFWAKNGGFRWRKGDWDDYKSTVLRRKGPNGTTLSGATKTTELGGGSVVGEVDRDDEGVFMKGGLQGGGRKGKVPRGNKNGHDNDVRAYRHEKAARVGGLNREADGNYHTEYTDFGYTDASDISQQSIHNEKKQYSHKPAAAKTPTKQKSTFYAHTPSSTDSHRPLRPNAAQPSSRDSTPTRSRQASPRKHTPNRKRNSNNSNPSVPGNFGSYTEPLDFDSRYTASEADTDGSRGTKAYFHPIPGLGAGGGSAGGYAGGGFRRGGAGRRRDSLSDSEGEDTVRS